VVAGSDGVSVMLGVAPAVLEQTPSYEVAKAPLHWRLAISMAMANRTSRLPMATRGTSRYC